MRLYGSSLFAYHSVRMFGIRVSEKVFAVIFYAYGISVAVADVVQNVVAGIRAPLEDAIVIVTGSAQLIKFSSGQWFCGYRQGYGWETVCNLIPVDVQSVSGFAVVSEQGFRGWPQYEKFHLHLITAVSFDIAHEPESVAVSAMLWSCADAIDISALVSPVFDRKYRKGGYSIVSFFKAECTALRETFIEKKVQESIVRFEALLPQVAEYRYVIGRFHLLCPCILQAVLPF